jgi:hypothetical protein
MNIALTLLLNFIFRVWNLATYKKVVSNQKRNLFRSFNLDRNGISYIKNMASYE